MEAVATYQVIDRQTGAVAGTFKNRNAARSKRDRLDLAHGAVRYMVREVQAVAAAHRTEIVEESELPRLGRQVMEFDAARNLVRVNGVAVQGGAQ